LSSEKEQTGMIRYYRRYRSRSNNIDRCLREIGCRYASTYRHYQKLIPVAEANGIENYTGTTKQNLYLIDLARRGKLIVPDEKAKRRTYKQMNDREYDDLVKWVKDHSRFYNMRKLCEKYEFNYSHFSNWNAGRLKLKTSELKSLKKAMKNVSSD
jgi:hypothetical protein